MRNKPKFAHVKVKLTGFDGNALTIMGRVSRAMRDAGISEVDITAYTDEAMSGDYNNLLNVSAKTVSVS